VHECAGPFVRACICMRTDTVCVCVCARARARWLSGRRDNMIAPCVHITKSQQPWRDDEGGSEGGAGGDCETCATPGRLFPLMMYCTFEVAIWATPDRAAGKQTTE
jgi:hypothetical protein